MAPRVHRSGRSRVCSTAAPSWRSFSHHAHRKPGRRLADPRVARTRGRVDCGDIRQRAQRNPPGRRGRSRSASPRCAASRTASPRVVTSLHALLTREGGKPIRQSHNELNALAGPHRFLPRKIGRPRFAPESVLAGPQDKLVERITHEPLGVIANISAWNYRTSRRLECVRAGADRGERGALQAFRVRHADRARDRRDDARVMLGRVCRRKCSMWIV